MQADAMISPVNPFSTWGNEPLIEVLELPIESMIAVRCVCLCCLFVNVDQPISGRGARACFELTLSVRFNYVLLAFTHARRLSSKFYDSGKSAKIDMITGTSFDLSVVTQMIISSDLW